jgi:tRNA pseudouridine55 synthase
VVSEVAIPEARVRDALAFFEGVQMQRPPAYSAKHVGGERSHRLARRGEQVELADVSITVHQLELVDYRPPEVSFRAMVNAGTYIRALARDLGERLGIGAHLTSLRREAIGSIQVDAAVSLDRVSPDAILPPQAVLGNLPTVDLDESDRRAVQHGRPVRGMGEEASGQTFALLSQGSLVAVARTEDGWLKPTVVLESA